MNTNISTQRLEIRLMMTALVVTSLPLFAALASAQDGPTQNVTGRGFIDPAEIDSAVEEFTGAGIGQVGGAHLPADRRLRLAPCVEPLKVKWHGRAQTIVRVDCPTTSNASDGWRIFMATSSVKPAPQITKVVARGDPITVIVKGRGFSVQQSAEAMEAGAIGDWIAVRTQARADAIRARIERPGLAIIPAG